jgi:hypothetical protein
MPQRQSQCGVRKRKPQWIRFANLLKSRPGQRIHVREFSEISVQHGARFNELRTKKGYVIDNYEERRDGLVLSYYKLISAPADEAGSAYPPAGQGKLFQPTQPEESRREHVLEIQRTSL